MTWIEDAILAAESAVEEQRDKCKVTDEVYRKTQCAARANDVVLQQLQDALKALRAIESPEEFQQVPL